MTNPSLERTHKGKALSSNVIKPMTELRKGIAKDLNWLKEFYAEAGYRGKVQDEDQVFFAIDDSRITGVVRLAAEHSSLVLRGMQIAQNSRRKGIGSTLLSYLVSDLGEQPCFCLPYTHLEEFYAAEGFRVANDNEIPQFLAERKYAYLSRGMDVISMVRHSAGPVL